MQAGRVAAVRRSSAPTANANGASSGSPHASSGFPRVLWQPAWPLQATLVESANRTCNLTFVLYSPAAKVRVYSTAYVNGVFIYVPITAWVLEGAVSRTNQSAGLLICWIFLYVAFNIYSYYLYCGYYLSQCGIIYWCVWWGIIDVEVNSWNLYSSCRGHLCWIQ